MQEDKFRKVLDKIRKLLAMTNSPYPEEAASALAMAKELMLKYNIEMKDVEGQAEDIIEIDFEMARSMDASIKIAFWIQQAFLCKALNIKTKVGKDIKNSIRFIGSKSSVAVATFVFSYIVYLLETTSSQYFLDLPEEIKIKSKKKKVIEGFQYGFALAIETKLKAIETQRIAAMEPSAIAEENALIVVNNALVNRYVDEQYPNRNEGRDKTIKTNARHEQEGFNEGSKYGIFKGVQGNETKIKIGDK